MTFAKTQRWLEQLIAGDEAALAVTAGEAGYAEPAKTATNLALLQEVLKTPKLVISLARQALTTADPDLALNNL
jgi:glutamate-ammonia-ligase adenylyltransferase